ncbi:MAG: hypothetical protein ACFE96_17565 [Candidatus Hermodarchaeota archaeon]
MAIKDHRSIGLNWANTLINTPSICYLGAMTLMYKGFVESIL